MKKNIINTNLAPAAIGPYSQAIETKGMLFVSGQIPINPAEGDIEAVTIEQQTVQVMINLSSILKEAGYKLEDVVKTTCYLSDMQNFAKMNEVYARFFKEHAPARATVEVGRLPKDVLVEIDCIAVK